MMTRFYCFSRFMPTALGVAFCVVLFALGLQGCGEKPAPPAMPRFVVDVEPLQREVLSVAHDYIAEVENRSAIDIRPRMAGYVDQILVQEGDVVQKGQLLIALDAQKQAAQVASAKAGTQSIASQMETTIQQRQSVLKEAAEIKAQAYLAKTTFQRVDALHKKGAVSPQQWQESKSQWDIQQARLESVQSKIKVQDTLIAQAHSNYRQALENEKILEEDLAYFRIKAPFSGVVGHLPFKVGELVSSTDIVTTLTQTKAQTQLVFEAPVESLSYIKKGQRIELRDEAGTLTHQGKITFISPQLNRGVQSMVVKSSVETQAKALALLSAQRVHLHVMEPQGKQAVLPVEALVFMGTQAFVYTTKADAQGQAVAARVPVVLGDLVGNRYVLKSSSLKEGDPIIIGGIQMLQDGSPVQIAKKK
jgi:RND family efflux transporter MFP subunit